ncbi:MAG TPA: methyl-accepting chemotaxis protein, partial [Ramlibacter sp.]
MFKNFKVGTRLVAGFLIVSMLGALVAGIGIFNMGKINDKADAIYEQELLGISHVKQANIALVYMARELRNLLLASSVQDRDRFVQNIDKARSLVKEQLEKARPLFLTDEGKQKLAAFDRAFAEYDGLLNETVGKARREEMEMERPIVQYMYQTVFPKAQAADDSMTELTKLKEENARSAADEAAALYNTSRALMIVLVLVSTGVGFALGIVVTRSITRPLSKAVGVAQAVAGGDLTTSISADSADEVGQLLGALREMNESLVKVVTQVRVGTDTIATATGQIAAGNQDLSSRTEEQASSLEETAASMEELTGTVKQNADNAGQANQLAQSASEIAARGGAVVAEAVQTMSAINESSKKIAEIISVIDGIAFQTNILALNAAVEAARAGEQGRGFAVVAAEVRSLAQRSATAAKEIKVLIEDSVSKVNAGSSQVARTGETMQEIVGSIRRVTDLMGEIAAASQEQSSGIEQVNQAITQMDQVTQQNAALVEEAAAASHSLQEQAGHLVSAVSVFKLESSAEAGRVIAQARA